ncbi:MAG: methyltransferase domain-containing protein [Magnetococcales bacterium]|nr:class I SAM-dependent methyltransferase [Magnetococcales bacterium]NGZ04846.1 methyltransferase domain-containing protein [Magnetococcales bacterium]
MERRHGKPIDIGQFKKPVLHNLLGHLDKIRGIVSYLASHETPIHQQSCHVCGSREAVPRVEIHQFTYVTCAECGLVYTSRRYSDEAIRRFYATNRYWSEVTYANRETCHYRRDQVAKPKVEFAERHLGNERGVWVDVGSGIGDLVSVVQERGWQGVGLELSATSVAFAKEVFGVNLEQTTLEEYLTTHPEWIGTIQVVSLIGVLEHVTDPMGLLATVQKILVPGGAALIQVPNANSLASMVQEVFPDNVFRHMSPIEHIMLFTEPALMRALELNGFEPIAWWFHGLDIYELLTNLVISHHDRMRDSALYHTLLATMNNLQQVIDDQELSDRIICLARKKITLPKT